MHSMPVQPPPLHPQLRAVRHVAEPAQQVQALADIVNEAMGGLFHRHERLEEHWCVRSGRLLRLGL